jgi:hypothetical protein
LGFPDDELRVREWCVLAGDEGGEVRGMVG